MPIKSMTLAKIEQMQKDALKQSEQDNKQTDDANDYEYDVNAHIDEKQETMLD
eukprot:CAMPEP_0197527460 /NCGR_PEP_ID=MMETSP1318-20131121/21742_1 /TAXON_ID=552666 /ORGANISM="Partenskyella glossopodia, Strain RCC365" /LENGTH=52 /DNA_ID=CAMNT_0043082121 /DNA_START=154 /DNA_END=312 /DNA_ORIENTATION=+